MPGVSTTRPGPYGTGAGPKGSKAAARRVRSMKRARSQAATQVQETSWQSSTANEGIPTYNANADPLCPLAMARKFNRVEKLRADAAYDTSRSPKGKGKGSRSPGKSGLGHLPPMMRSSASMPELPVSDEAAAAAAARAANGTAPDRAAGPRGEAVLSKTPLAGPGLPQMDSTYGTAWVQGSTSVRPGSVDPSTLGPVRSGGGSVGGANGPANTNMSTEVASIISWQESDAGIELECIRCVVRREKLLQDLTDLVRQEVDTGVASVPDPVVQELVTGLRMVTLETVEAIARWKLSREATKPEGHDDFPAHPHCTFVYRQANYLLKIVSDVDFLENSPTIQRLYPSIQLYGNPFLSPAPLADRPAVLNLAVDPVLKAQTMKAMAFNSDDVLRLHDAERLILAEATRLAVRLERKADEEAEQAAAAAVAEKAAEEAKRAAVAAAEGSIGELGDLSAVGSGDDAGTAAAGSLEEGSALTFKTGTKVNDSAAAGTTTVKSTRALSRKRGLGLSLSGATNNSAPTVEDKLVKRLADLSTTLAVSNQRVGELGVEVTMHEGLVERLTGGVNDFEIEVSIAERRREPKLLKMQAKLKYMNNELDTRISELRTKKARLFFEQQEVKRLNGLQAKFSRELEQHREKVTSRAREREERERERLDGAAQNLQKIERGRQARLVMQPKIVERRDAALKIESAHRRKQARKWRKEEGEKQNNAARVVQSRTRGMLSRRRVVVNGGRARAKTPSSTDRVRGSDRRRPQRLNEVKTEGGDEQYLKRQEATTTRKGSMINMGGVLIDDIEAAQAATLAREAELEAAEKEADGKGPARSDSEAKAKVEELEAAREALRKKRELESRVVEDMSIYNYFHASAIAGAQPTDMGPGYALKQKLRVEAAEFAVKQVARDNEARAAAQRVKEGTATDDDVKLAARSSGEPKNVPARGSLEARTAQGSSGLNVRKSLFSDLEFFGLPESIIEAARKKTDKRIFGDEVGEAAGILLPHSQTDNGETAKPGALGSTRRFSKSHSASSNFELLSKRNSISELTPMQMEQLQGGDADDDSVSDDDSINETSIYDVEDSPPAQTRGGVATDEALHDSATKATDLSAAERRPATPEEARATRERQEAEDASAKEFGEAKKRNQSIKLEQEEMTRRVKETAAAEAAAEAEAEREMEETRLRLEAEATAAAVAEKTDADAKTEFEAGAEEKEEAEKDANRRAEVERFGTRLSQAERDEELRNAMVAAQAGAEAKAMAEAEAKLSAEESQVAVEEDAKRPSVVKTEEAIEKDAKRQAELERYGMRLSQAQAQEALEAAMKSAEAAADVQISPQADCGEEENEGDVVDGSEFATMVKANTTGRRMSSLDRAEAAEELAIKQAREEELNRRASMVRQSEAEAIAEAIELQASSRGSSPMKAGTDDKTLIEKVEASPLGTSVRRLTMRLSNEQQEVIDAMKEAEAMDRAKQDADVKARHDDWAKTHEVIKGQTVVELAVSAVRQISSAEASMATSAAMMRVMQVTLARVKANAVSVTLPVQPVLEAAAPALIPVQSVEPVPERNDVGGTDLNETSASADADLLINLQYEQQILSETIAGLALQIKSMMGDPASPLLDLAADTTSLGSASLDGSGSYMKGGLAEATGGPQLDGGLVEALTSQTMLNSNVSVLVEKLADLEIRQATTLEQLKVAQERAIESEERAAEYELQLSQAFDLSHNFQGEMSPLSSNNPTPLNTGGGARYSRGGLATSTPPLYPRTPSSPSDLLPPDMVRPTSSGGEAEIMFISYDDVPTDTPPSSRPKTADAAGTASESRARAVSFGQEGGVEGDEPLGVDILDKEDLEAGALDKGSVDGFDDGGIEMMSPLTMALPSPGNQRTYSAGSELSEEGHMTGVDHFDGDEEYGAVAREDLTVRTPGTVPATPAVDAMGTEGGGGEVALSARRRFDERSGDGLRTPEITAVAPARRRAARYLSTQGKRALAFLDLVDRVAVVLAYSSEEMEAEKTKRRQASLQLQRQVRKAKEGGLASSGVSLAAGERPLSAPETPGVRPTTAMVQSEVRAAAKEAKTAMPKMAGSGTLDTMGIVVGKYETAVMLPVKKREARTIAQRWLTQKADQALAQEWLQGKAQNAAGIKPAEATEPVEPVEPVEPPLLMAPVPSPKTNVLKDLTDAQISDVFNRFDTDLNGYLDTFELADAVNELTGQVLSTGQTMHLVEKYELANTERDPPNSLTELEFGDMVRTIDWDSDDWRTAGGSPLRGTVATSGADQPNGTPYEVVFEQNTLGFRVRTDTTRGLVVVNQVTDPLNLGVIFVGDLLVAVNGAPLGYILDHKVLAKKIKSLGRPMKITFEVSLEGRNAALRERPDTADPEIALNPAKTWSDEKLKRVFLDFDRDQSDSLDTFELGPALTELLGRDFDSSLVAELVTKYDTNGSNTIEFDEFLIMIRSIDTATLDVPTTPQRPATAGGSIDADTFEVTFRKSSLGFRVRNDTERGLIIIKELIKPHAPSTPGTPGMPGTPSTPGGSKGRGDHLDPRVVPGLIVFAVNGAPMGWVNHHKVLAEKIRGLDRPIRVTFKRDIEGGSAKPAQPIIEETQETQAEEKPVA